MAHAPGSGQPEAPGPPGQTLAGRRTTRHMENNGAPGSQVMKRVRAQSWWGGRVAAVAAILLGLTACATVRGVLALRQVTFEVDRVAAVRLAGVSLDRIRGPADVGMLEAARIAAAVARRQVPVEFEVHLLGRNPAENHTTARLVRMHWILDLNGHETVSGTLDTAYTFAPGEVTDVRLPVALDLWRFFQGSAADVLNLALGLAGLGARPTEVVLRAVPTIDTPLGPIQYPGSITIVRRTVAGP